MASAFADAITAGMIAQMDPMNGVIRSMAAVQLKASEQQLETGRLEIMATLRATIKECQDNGEDPKVIAAYQRMLDSYSK